jgi:hypothetical protein
MYKILSSILLSRLIPYAEEILGDHQCGFWHKSQLLVIYSAFTKYEKKWEYSAAVRQIFIDLKKAYDSVSREVLYNILCEFGIPMKLLRQIKVFLNETYSSVQVGKNLCDMFLIKNGLKQGDALLPLLFNSL